MKKAFYTVLVLASIGSTSQALAQCKTFTKKQCMPLLKPYIHNGQMNNITLFPGEDASLVQTFYSGQNYRVQLCAQENLGDSTYFKVVTENNDVVYSTQHQNEQFWDFNVANTQNLKITVIVPDSKPADEIEQNGCVAVLIGFKD